ncbi:MAG: hypothetical protein ACLGI6_01105 [Gammaproteobacteria bacterium]
MAATLSALPAFIARLLVWALLACALPAQAGNSVFDRIKDVLTGLVDSDHIEMARFSIEHPAEAATVYYRAGIQDYPFFAMVGAAKAAKNRDLPGIGVFTMDRCLTPITAIDGVFRKADSTISNLQGKAATAEAMNAAAAIAADYAKAGTEQARQQLIQQLNQSVPYFSDIPTICLFAFDTDLKIEKDVFLVAGQVAQDIRSAYSAFASGDVVTGSAILMKLGASKDVVCTMVDQAVGGGIIGRTPLLGTLAKTACSGFVGAVIDGINGIIKGGVGLIEDGANAAYQAGKSVVCAVWSLIGNGCSSSPPPTGLSNGAAYCAARGGVESFLSKTNAPNDYRVRCNDGSMCNVTPERAACATGAEIAAMRAQRIALAEADFQQKLPQWQNEFAGRWLKRCPAAPCETGIKFIQLNATLLAKQAHEAHPEAPYTMTTYFIFEAADRQAVDIIEEYRYRILPEQWSANFLARHQDACQDQACRNAIKIVALNTRLLVRQRGELTPRPPYGGSTPLYAKAEQQADAMVAESSERSADYNKKVTAEAGAAWEVLTNAVWGKQCADAQCVAEIKQLSAKMRAYANLLQIGLKDESSLKIQGMASKEYGPKFKAAVTASQQRVAAQTPALPPPASRPVAPLQPWIQRVQYPVARGPLVDLGLPQPRSRGVVLPGPGRRAPVRTDRIERTERTERTPPVR